MKIVMISSDPKVLENTATARRIEEYRNLVDDLYTIVIAGRLNVLAFFRAYHEGARILRVGDAKDFLITAQDPPERWIVGWLLARKFRVPLEVQVHTDLMSPYLLSESFKNRIRLLIAKFILPRASCVRVVSERIRKSLIAWKISLASKISVLPVYVDVERLRQLHHVEDYGIFQFLVVSRFTREKNIALAINAFAKIVTEFPKTKLIIVGDGPYRQKLETLALKYNLMEEKILFTGWLEDVTRHYQYANCYLLTSNYEGYGRTVVEALAAGVPVIMTDVGVAGDIVENEKNGLVVPVGEKPALVSAMRRVLTDSYLHRILSENSRMAVKDFPSKEKYLELYKTMWHTCGRKS
jgi:glycosyltransferase involved in cell wall biosynthesis